MAARQRPNLLTLAINLGAAPAPIGPAFEGEMLYGKPARR